MSIIAGATSWNAAVTAMFSGISLPYFNNFHLMMVVKTFDE